MRARTERKKRVDLRPPVSKMKYAADTKKSNIFPGGMGSIGTLESVTAGNGISVTVSGTNMSVATSLKTNGGLVIESSKLAVDLGASSITGTLAIGDGGTGATSLTDHGVLVGSGTSAITALAVGTNGQILIGSTGADPVFGTITDGDGITTTVGAGTLAIAVTLATNSGLTFSSSDLAIGTPSDITPSSSNSITTNTHTHAYKSTPCIVTTTYTVLPANDIVIGNSTTGFTITMMPATGSGRKVTIKNINTGNVTIEGDSSDTIDGSLNAILVQWDSITVYDYAANSWCII